MTPNNRVMSEENYCATQAYDQCVVNPLPHSLPVLGGVTEPMADDSTIEQLIASLERQAGDFRIEWHAKGRYYTIWTGYDYEQGWYGKEGGDTLREALQNGLTPP